MRFPIYSVLALASVVSAAPSLRSRQAATIVNGITCQILGEQIDDPSVTLAAVQRGSIQAPTGLSTEQFSDLLRQCISGSSGSHHPHTKAAAFNDGTGEGKVADANPSAYANSAGSPGSTQDNTSPTTSDASAGGADGAPNGSNDSASTPPADADSPPANSPNDSSPPADTSASAPAPASAATDSTPATADSPDGANSAGSSDSNSGGNGDNSAASRAAVNPEVNPSSSSDASSAGGDPAPSPNAEAAPPSDVPVDASNGGGDSSPAGAAIANDDNSAPANNGNPASANNDSPAPAPSNADNAANAPDAAGSPFLAYDGSPSGPEDPSDSRRLHAHQNNSNGKSKCTGVLCVGEKLASIPGLGEMVGSGGISQGSAGCPSGDIKACLRARRR